MRRAFTFVEMMISVSLLAVIILFLYTSLSKLQQGNRFYASKLEQVEEKSKLIKTLYLDLSLAKKGSLSVISKDKYYDILLMQTKHSVHQRIMPYVGYIVSKEGFFRIESSKKLNYPLSSEIDMLVDMLSEVKNFRVYISRGHALVDIDDGGDKMLLKVRLLNY